VTKIIAWQQKTAKGKSGCKISSKMHLRQNSAAKKSFFLLVYLFNRDKYFFDSSS